VVTNPPSWIPRALARYVACTSAIEYAFSSGVWWPGRLPISTTWLWQSMMPGIAVRPRRSIIRGLSSNPCLAVFTLSPAYTIRPSLIATTPTTRLRPSIVWIRPLCRIRSARNEPSVPWPPGPAAALALPPDSTPPAAAAPATAAPRSTVRREMPARVSLGSVMRASAVSGAYATAVTHAGMAPLAVAGGGCSMDGSRGAA
jgi:hypothetical protein